MTFLMLNIDEKQVRTLAAINCTMLEIASVMKCSVDTLERRFADTIKEGRAEGRASLRRKMWSAVQAGSIPMMIFMSKNLLGYTDKPLIEEDDDNTLYVEFNSKIA